MSGWTDAALAHAWPTEATAIAALLYREQLAAELGGELLRGLLSSSARVRAGYATDPGLAEVLPPGARATIVVGRSVDPADVEVVLRQRAAWTLYTVTTDEVVVLVPVGAGAAGPARGRRRRDRCARSPSAVVGISEAHATHAALHRRLPRGRRTRYASARAVPALGRVAEWSRLGAYRLLVRAATDDAAIAGLIDPRLAPVLDSPELLATLEVYLETAGRAAESAERLGIHRATLYYRLPAHRGPHRRRPRQRRGPARVPPRHPAPSIVLGRRGPGLEHPSHRQQRFRDIRRSRRAAGAVLRCHPRGTAGGGVPPGVGEGNRVSCRCRRLPVQP